MFSPLSPKFHGAYLGAGSAAAIANVIIGLIWPHGGESSAYIQLIYAGVGVVLAGFGAWVMPPAKPTAVPPAVLTQGTGTTSSLPQMQAKAHP